MVIEHRAYGGYRVGRQATQYGVHGDLFAAVGLPIIKRTFGY